MAYCYTKHYSEDWLQKVATQKQIECWEERARDEASRREKRGVVNTPSAGLEYANLYDLREIIRRHWQPVSPALGARKETDALLSEAVRFLALLDRADALRNTVAHSRELLPFEEDLLAGIAGDIENRVTIYMSSQDRTVTPTRGSRACATPLDRSPAWSPTTGSNSGQAPK